MDCENKEILHLASPMPYLALLLIGPDHFSLQLNFTFLRIHHLVLMGLSESLRQGF